MFRPNKITLTAKSGEGYCNDILDLTGGLEMDFAKGRPYIGCRAVNKVTTYLYSSPVDQEERTEYWFPVHAY